MEQLNSNQNFSSVAEQFAYWFREQHPSIPLQGAFAVIRLAEEGGTVPFIARYRKEQTGNLDEVAIDQVIKAKERWEEILQRKGFILSEIEAQDKLTPELRQKIEATFDLRELEDLYLPYKRKRKTKAAIAREAGLEPLSIWIWECGHGTVSGQTMQANQDVAAKAAEFVNAEAGVADANAAIEGAQAILIERLAELPALRQEVRRILLEQGVIISRKGENAKTPSKFDHYFEFHESVQSLMRPEAGHRYLAMRRGQSEGELVLTLGGPPEDTDFLERLQRLYEEEACSVKSSPVASILLKAARLAFKVHVFLSIESEVHSALKEAADRSAIEVFAENVRKLLLAAPLGAKCVLGVDPGQRTGCKLALVDRSGKFLASGVIHLLTDEQRVQSAAALKTVLQKGKVEAIAVGNGTGSRETEKFLRDVVTDLKLKIPVVVVSESGASVYSASEVAREEFPDLDLTVRGAISIARRLQDPLAELVKVDPKSIGVGQYQHDVSQTELKRSLERVVESCVNSVGVDLNTASLHLLAYVSGIGSALAKAIVDYRSTKGLFTSREELLTIPRFGGKAFEQAAGFLRISGAGNPLDSTGVHPERYPILQRFAEAQGRAVADLLGPGVGILKGNEALRAELGEFTFLDIVQELEKPGRDPRDQFVAFEFREDIHDIPDLRPGMVCPGVVTNVTNFGAFVDIGVHQDGLVHISQLSDTFVKDVRSVVSPGDHVKVTVLEVDLAKRQIALSMRQDAGAEVQRRADGGSRERGPRPQVARGPGDRAQGQDRHGGQSRDRRREPERVNESPFANLGAMLKTPSR